MFSRASPPDLELYLQAPYLNSYCLAVSVQLCAKGMTIQRYQKAALRKALLSQSHFSMSQAVQASRFVFIISHNKNRRSYLTIDDGDHDRYEDCHGKEMGD